MYFLKKCFAVLVLFSILLLCITKIEKSYYEKNKYDEISPLIMTLSGGKLTKEEKAYISKINPFGFIFFTNNLYSKSQVKKLTKDIKKILRRNNIFFMIDQEGGSISKLKEVYKKDYKSLSYFGNLYKTDPEKAKEEIFEYAKETAEEMADLGLNLNLSPVLDLRKKNIKPSNQNQNDIQTRTISDDIEIVVELAREYNRGLMENKVYGCMKHLPGLGSSYTDTHKEKSIISDSLDELKSSDFLPFKKLSSDFKFGLMSLATYLDIDSENIAIFSKSVIQTIKKEIGFNGLIISDALSMGAVKEFPITERVLKTLEAGVDVAMIDDATLQEALYIKNSLPKLKVRFFNIKLKKLGLR